MKKVVLKPNKRQELTDWLLDNLRGKDCNATLQFSAQNEEEEVEEPEVKELK